MRQRVFLYAKPKLTHLIKMWKINDRMVARPKSEDNFDEYGILNSDNKQVSRFFRGECEIIEFKDNIECSPVIEGEAPPLIESLVLNFDRSKLVYLDFYDLVQKDVI